MAGVGHGAPANLAQKALIGAGVWIFGRIFRCRPFEAVFRADRTNIEAAEIRPAEGELALA
jgi:hypothetical protein